MKQRDIIIGFMAITALGVVVSTVIMFTMAGLGTPEEYYLWQQIVNFFIMLYFVGMIPYFLNERKNESSTTEQDVSSLS